MTENKKRIFILLVFLAVFNVLMTVAFAYASKPKAQEITTTDVNKEFITKHVKKTTISSNSIAFKLDSNAILVNDKMKRLNYKSSIIPFTNDKEILVPIELFAKEMGARTYWQNNKQSFIVQYGKNTVGYNLNTKTLKVNDAVEQLGTLPRVFEEQLYVPLSSLSAVFSRNVISEDGYIVLLPSGTKDQEEKANADIQQYKKFMDTKITVLMYHALNEKFTTSTTVNPHAFREQLKLLKENGFTTISSDDLFAFYNGEKTLPARPLMITFDDGYYSNYQYAYPALKEYGMQATIFVIVDDVLNPKVHPSVNPKLTWEQMRVMEDSGYVSIQSHTNNMHWKDGKRAVITGPIHIKGKLETDHEYRERVEHDLSFAKNEIQTKLNKKVISFAYPYGAHNNTSEQLVKKVGYKISFTTKPGFNTFENGPYLLHRINVDGKYSAQDTLDAIEKYLNE